MEENKQINIEDAHIDFNESVVNLINKDYEGNRKPPLHEVPIMKHKWFNNENDDLAESKNFNFNNMMCYLKVLQLHYSDKITAIQHKDLNEKEVDIWWKEERTINKKLVESFSLVELTELHGFCVKPDPEDSTKILIDANHFLGYSEIVSKNGKSQRIVNPYHMSGKIAQQEFETSQAYKDLQDIEDARKEKLRKSESPIIEEIVD